MTTLTTEAAWEQLPSLPVPSGNFVCGTVGNDIVIAGGITWKNDTKIWLDDIRRFDTKKKIWSNVGKLPQPLAYAAVGQTAKEIYFSGGSDGKMTSSDFCSLDSNLMFQKRGNVSSPRVYAATAISGSKLFVIAGGGDVVDLKTLTNTFYSVDLATGKTEALLDFPGGNFIVPTATAIDGKIFVFTGATFDAEKSQANNSDAAFVYSIPEAKWSALKSFPYTVRGLTSCVLDERHIFLAGGYRQDFTDEAFVYDTKKDSYSKTTSLPYRGMVSLIKVGDHVYCFGGEDKMRHRSDLVYRIAWKELLKK